LSLTFLWEYIIYGEKKDFFFEKIKMHNLIKKCCFGEYMCTYGENILMPENIIFSCRIVFLFGEKQFIDGEK
jgi:hypothetical protein